MLRNPARSLLTTVLATALLCTGAHAQGFGQSGSYPPAPTQPGFAAPTQPSFAAPTQPGFAAPSYDAPYAAQNGTQGFAAPANPARQTGALNGTYSAGDVVETGHAFFGSTSGSLAGVVERLFSRYGLPNGYILGEEGSGAFIGGVSYGEGTLTTRNAGQHRIYWQGPSIGFDAGAQGSRVMILVYNLPDLNSALGRFAGVSGEAFVVGGLGTRVLKRGPVLMVPVRTGVGARLGVNLSYLKFTTRPTWNPF